MGLTAAQMAQMSALLDQALELDDAQRRHWLERLAPEHRELAAALRQALLGDGSAQLVTLPKFPDAAISSEVGAQPGALVGPYRLIRPLGGGGMAEVWLAERADGAFKREIALKLPRLGGPRQDLTSRFARERDILACLEHPNIARLYDAGVSAEGLPYLAMEYVAGQPLTAWCDGHQLRIRERLKLFLQVLDAVQYAHGHQVLHRDIKPSNILVTESGQVRLLDFGVAKLLEQQEQHTELTQVYGRALTPGYASPELLRGERVEAASDIYALGVLLYELLAGSRPYRLQHGASLTAIEQAVMAAPVQPPSSQVQPDTAAARATTAEKVSRRLRGDLDAIVLKALARQPHDRYPSASALADDLQRYLSGEPVEARPDTAPYRLGKFALRHRAGVAMGAAAVVLVAAAVVYELTRSTTGPGGPQWSLTAPAGQQGAEAKRAATPAAPTEIAAPEKSIAVLPFVDMSEKHDQEYFSDGLAEELLDLLSRVPTLHVAARTSAFSFKGKSDDIPTIARKLLVANVLEGSVRKAGNRVRITVQLVRAENGYHLWSETYDRKLDDIFKIQDEIAGAVVQALKVSLLEGRLPTASVSQNIEAYTLYLQARSIYSRAGMYSDQKKIVDYLERALKLDPTYAPAWALLSRAHVTLAYVSSRNTQDWDEARRAAVKALALDPKLPDAHVAMALLYGAVDWDWTAEQAQLQQALALDPNDAAALALAGWRSIFQGRVDRSLDLLRRSIASDPINAWRHFYLAAALYNSGRFDEALLAIRKCLDLNPTMEFAHWFAAVVFLAKGDPRMALTEINLEPDEQLRLHGRVLAYHALRRDADGDATLGELEKKYPGYADKNPVRMAEVWGYRGDNDQAFAWLDRAYRQHDPILPAMRADPLLEGLRPDPRFKALVRKMKLPE
jgi:serine/threonine protein kinase/TolB-like protein/lipoprotein NlpI